jgi:hypothetical protein
MLIRTRGPGRRQAFDALKVVLAQTTGGVQINLREQRRTSNLRIAPALLHLQQSDDLLGILLQSEQDSLP